MKFAPGGWRYAILPLLAAPFALVYSVAASLLALVVGAFVLLFFRDPERTPPLSGVVSPADGKVSVLREEGEQVRLGVFMNVWNVHVIRAPFAGDVTAVDHSPGAHRPAFSKDSDRNEKVHVRFATDGHANEGWGASEGSEKNENGNGDETETDTNSPEVTLIAGAFARRIFPYVDAGDQLERGERLGHIAFGSRVDVLFPPDVDRDDIAVSLGERVTAGETIVLESGTGDELEIEGLGE
ncbi:protein sorting system archaetidylserine decarboxylase [Halobacteria archaeon AArc-m2/3/4]|uniref:Protein sorting system archaetidylserine decarboxylase n=1 Tax=Natronoglomus mannanivorans TaxID=2979990 RepID=A0ABT2QLR3_9EURY|nr:protein sorting system archaetidylserine decarboxylase [Halobacteria archaeon AArc-m2/3/4]